MASVPSLDIPESTNTIDVSIIDTTHSIRGIPAGESHTYLGAPVFAFLIEQHSPKGTRRLLFDLGIRKDYWNFPPATVALYASAGFEFSVRQSVREILESNNVPCSDDAIESIIWSHWHMDHTGDPSEFPSSTSIIVGPGVKEGVLPGYPANPDSQSLLESDYAGRDLIELDFDNDPRAKFKIGQFKALDYFEDGSFYLLDSPGHAIGHICGLARVTSNPDSFIFMGGDAAHHAAEWRPSPFLPLPEEISPHPFAPMSLSKNICPGEMFSTILANGPTKPIYEPARKEVGQVHHNVDEAIRTIEKMQEYDAESVDNILVAVAHDETLLDVVDFFPKKANGFMEKGWVRQVRWKFLSDFAEAVGWEGVVEGKREWGPTKEEKNEELK